MPLVPPAAASQILCAESGGRDQVKRFVLIDAKSPAQDQARTSAPQHRTRGGAKIAGEEPKNRGLGLFCAIPLHRASECNILIKIKIAFTNTVMRFG